MRNIVVAILMLTSFSVFGQKNVLLDQAFWRGKPDLNQVKAEVEKGSDPTQANPGGSDAIVLAINAQAPNDAVEYLLSRPGVNVNKGFAAGRTYLFYAAGRANTALMETLVKKGAKTTTIDNAGYSVLTYAAATGQTDTKIYDILIANGANPKDKIRGGANALLLLAPVDKDLSLINYFVSKGIDIKSVDSVGATAFDYAVRSGNVTVLKALVEKGVKYSPAAMVTAAQGSRNAAPTLETYQYLETLKLDPKATNTNGDNVLHFIVRRANQEDIIKHFLEKGVDVNQANADGTTPFMNAAYLNADVTTLDLLSTKVKDINARNKAGMSALSFAVRRNSPEVVKLLLDKGADIKVTDAEGYNLTYYLIHSYSEQRPDPFEGKLKLLRERGLDITTPQQNGNTLYHMVLYRNGLPLLKRIEEFKVDVNARNKEGLAPIHKAAMTAKDDSIIKYLISIGAKKDVKTDFEETAYDLARENEYLTKNKVSIDFLK